MQITNQYFVFYEGRTQILYQTNQGYWVTTQGAFGQRPTTFEWVEEKDAKELIYQNSFDRVNSRLPLPPF